MTEKGRAAFSIQGDMAFLIVMMGGRFGLT